LRAYVNTDSNSTKLLNMCKLRYKVPVAIRQSLARGIASCVCVLALTLQNAQSQTPPDCLQGGMAAVITVRPTVAHAGDVVNITQLVVALGGSSCNVQDGQCLHMYPDGVTANVK